MDNVHNDNNNRHLRGSFNSELLSKTLEASLFCLSSDCELAQFPSRSLNSGPFLFFFLRLVVVSFFLDIFTDPYTYADGPGSVVMSSTHLTGHISANIYEKRNEMKYGSYGITDKAGGN